MINMINKDYLFDKDIENMFEKVLLDLEFSVDADDSRMIEIENGFGLKNVAMYAMSYEFNDLCVFGFEFLDGSREYYYNENGSVMLFANEC